MRRIRDRLRCFVILAGLVCASAAAQSCPVQPIRLILQFPAGAPSDRVGRAVARKLSEQPGRNIVPDGYTLLVTSPAIALSPSFYLNLPYGPAKDLVPAVTKDVRWVMA